ncbi:MAG: methyltransferase domain-containing protein [Desulfatitalea sp.]|nr:methyltransferase domain-containing protein [Desulfatitalea sp.]NNK01810.1 methyltransferase domain-containing protein [Desulfatitalea sp.]
MPRIFYKGKLSPFLKVGVISNNVIAWMNGNARDTDAMRKKIQHGYEGAYSDHVKHYDDFAFDHYHELAESLLNTVDCKDKIVLDVGSGTGILANVLLARGAKKVVCVDFSQYMLDRSKAKLEKMGYPSEKIEFKQADAENLPFEDNTFDRVVSGMMLGLAVNQEKVVEEMHRVLSPGGQVVISAHGPEWYYEISETLSMCLLKNYTMTNLGSSSGVEFWPITENIFERMLDKKGFTQTTIKNQKGRLNFNTGEQAWDFVAACSSAWFLGAFKPEERKEVVGKVKQYFIDKQTTTISYEALLGYGTKEAL